MKKALILLSVACIAASGYAISWMGNGFLVLDVNGGGNTWYDLDPVTGNLDFDSDNSSANAYSLTLTINEGESIKLGGQLQTYPQDSEEAYIGYRISTDFTGGFNELSLPYKENSGNNQVWEETGASMVEIGSSLSVGTYYLSIYQHAVDGTTDYYRNENGLNTAANDWEARIEVIPEPATMGLILLFGTSTLVIRRIFMA